MKKILVRAQTRASFGQAGIVVSVMVIAAALIAVFATRGTAQLTTITCIDCHVVHLWQDVEARERAAARAKARLSGVYTSIQEEACEGCHADSNSHTLARAGLNTVPIVKNGQEPEVPLAAGNFYYSSGQLHLKKAGGSCTSCHRNVKHHAASTGYRFLGPDIEGIGDPEFEHGQGRNIYKSGGQYCSACHANFCGTENQGSAGGGWIRHPTNTPIPMSGEYAGYVYNKLVPVSYPDPNNPERDTARVMCMSCHRPHGTPYDYLLRWDYSTIVAGGGENGKGCFACHSQKDEKI